MQKLPLYLYIINTYNMGKSGLGQNISRRPLERESEKYAINCIFLRESKRVKAFPSNFLRLFAQFSEYAQIIFKNS